MPPTIYGLLTFTALLAVGAVAQQPAKISSTCTDYTLTLGWFRANCLVNETSTEKIESTVLLMALLDFKDGKLTVCLLKTTMR
jgi:hypothetical protein